MSGWNRKPQSTGAFLDSVRQIREHWRVEEHKELWFRGEPGDYPSTKLRPKLYRPRLDNALKTIPELLDVEDDLYEDFRRSAGQLCDARPDDDWDWYFLMQHHGVPTRLLDWSDGALIALHFAVRVHECQPTKRDRTVFVLDPYWLSKHLKSFLDYDQAKEKWKAVVAANPSEGLTPDEWDRAYLPGDEEDQSETPLPKIPLLFDVDHINRRFAAQRSRLVLFGTDDAWLSHILEEEDQRLTMLRIEADHVERVRHELTDAGVTEAVIFPDLDGLGRELKQRFEERR